jgi:KDO2-lipid IV(A) lauroyltransferase
MPERAAYSSFDRIADTLWARRGKDVSRLESNLRRVVGPQVSDEELRALSRQGMRSYFRYWCDVFRMPSWSRERIISTMVAHDDHHLADGLAHGRGVVVALPHMGNWDHAGAWASLVHSPVTTVAERLEPEDLYDQFVAYRAMHGIDVIPLTGGDPPFPQLMDALAQGRLVALLGDRDLGRGGMSVQFFGEKAKMPAGPAALAVDSGAVLVTAELYLADGMNNVRFSPPIPVPTEGERSRRILRTTQLLADSYQEAVRRHPTDWHMLQRVWVADLDPTRAPSG